MPQAAACPEVSVAHPLSVFDKSEPGLTQSGGQWERKETAWTLSKLASKETGTKDWKRAVDATLRSQITSKAEHASCMLWRQGLRTNEEAEEQHTETHK